MSKSLRSHPRVRHLVFALLMSGLMSLLMSAIITLVNTGPAPGYLLRWLSSFIVAWAVAFPLVTVMAPLARRLTDLLLGAPTPTAAPASLKSPQ